MQRHLGTNKLGERVVVVFREVPNEPEYCLVANVAKMPGKFSNELMKIVNGHEAQSFKDNLADFLFRQTFENGANVLNSLHSTGQLKKVPCSDITMVLDQNTKISLSELNYQLQQIQKQRSAPQQRTQTVQESSGPAGVLDDAALAKKLLAQANTFEREVIRLRKEAAELDPSLAKQANLTTVNESESPKKRGRKPKKAEAAVEA